MSSNVAFLERRTWDTIVTRLRSCLAGETELSPASVLTTDFGAGVLGPVKGSSSTMEPPVSIKTLNDSDNAVEDGGLAGVGGLGGVRTTPTSEGVTGSAELSKGFGTSDVALSVVVASGLDADKLGPTETLYIVVFITCPGMQCALELLRLRLPPLCKDLCFPWSRYKVRSSSFQGGVESAEIEV